MGDPHRSALQPDWAEAVRDAARTQWTHDPAGAVHGGTAPAGTPEFFAAVERARYTEQPWMHETFGYDRFRGARVLEIGVGLGTDHMQFARAGALLTGVDLTPRSIEMTGLRLAHEGLHSDLGLMDAEALEFDDDSFDVVYSFGVLHHVPSSERTFREVRRVLRPGGCFLGGLYSRESFAHCRLVLPWALTGGFLRRPYDDLIAGVEHSTAAAHARPHVRLFGREELRAALQEAGFPQVALRRRHFGLIRIAPHLPAGVERLLGRIGGWYLVHDAR